MATDVEKLVVQLSADLRSFERDFQRSVGISNRTARAIEARFSAMDRRLSGIGRSAANGLIAPLSGVAAVLSIREVAAYADAWTKAKNSLAVAGVVGEQQVSVLDALYKSAQANSTPDRRAFRSLRQGCAGFGQPRGFATGFVAVLRWRGNGASGFRNVGR